MRVQTLDLMRFFAVLLVINSHMDGLYGKFKMLATGGAIGDGLFLFCTGYVLALSRLNRFDNWFKGKVARIAPSVIANSLIGILVFEIGNLGIVPMLGGEFIIALFSYYFVAYFLLKYFRCHLDFLGLFIVIASVLVYIVFFQNKCGLGESGIYGTATLFRWLPYFGFVIMGARACTRKRDQKNEVRVAFLVFAGSVVSFYGMALLMKLESDFAPFQIVTIIPLMACVYSFYLICESRLSEWFYSRTRLWLIINVISGLSLEAYLVQSFIFSTNTRSPSLINACFVFGQIVSLAFLCRIIARFLLQTFRDEEYNWIKMVNSA